MTLSLNDTAKKKQNQSKVIEHKTSPLMNRSAACSLLMIFILLMSLALAQGQQNSPSCANHTFSDESGFLTSPNYPESYPNNVYCEWTIHAATAHALSIRFLNFSLEWGNSRCPYDYLQIYDNNNTDPTKYCGTNTPPEFISNGTRVRIIFRTDGVVKSTGFRLSYTRQRQQNSPSCANHTFSDESGFLTSPNYPESYPNNVYCEWTIHAATTHALSIQFWNFSLEGGSRCPYDYLQIFDNHNTDPTKYCGTNTPPEFISNGTRVRILFRTDGSAVSNGFRLSYTRQRQLNSPSCANHTFNDESGFLTSPNYPESYPNNVYCEWTIHAATAHALSIQFWNFSLEGGSRCPYDYLQIFDNHNTIPTKYCGTNTPPEIILSTKGVRIIFRTDGSAVSNGFRLSYTRQPRHDSICGSNRYSSSGYLASPNFPRSYPNDVVCTWMIDATTGNVLNIQFQEFRLQGPSFDCNDYVELVDEDSQERFKYCASDTPPRFVSSGRRAKIIFHSGDAFRFKGFRLRFTSEPPETCPSATVHDGRSVCSNGRNVHSLCSHSCYNGFRRIGSRSSRCIVGRTKYRNFWSPSLPSCTATCPAISLPNGRSFCTDSRNVGSTCSHHCNQGLFELVGSATTSCFHRGRSGAVWYSSIPKCQAKCGPISISYGRTSCSNESSINSTCTLFCNDGFDLVGRNFRTCMENGSSSAIWSSPTPYCVPFCSPISLLNGTINCTNGRRIGSTCSFSCDEDFQLQGQQSSTCLKILRRQSAWNLQIPHCEAVCSQLNAENGNINCTNGRRHNSVCSYQCNEGYETIGNTATRCNVGQNGIGIWRPRPQVCRPFCSPISLLYGRIDCTNGRHIGSTCSFSCHGNFYLQGQQTSTCVQAGPRYFAWRSRLPRCEALCPSISLLNGRSNCTNGRRIGSICSFSCDRDFQLQGQQSSTCSRIRRRQSAWRPQISRCEAVCSQLNVENGNINCTNGRRHNSVCSYQCNEGYETIGNTASRCDVGQNGIAIWRPRPQVCRPKCLPLSIPYGRANCSNEASLNSKCTIICNDGFDLVGNKFRICISNGLSAAVWSSHAQYCVPFCSPISLLNGRINCTNGRRIGSTCSFSCNGDFHLQGQQISTCVQTRRGQSAWQSRIPRCEALCPSISLLNGTSNCTNGRRIGSTCSFSCDRDFQLQGQQSSTCLRIRRRQTAWRPQISRCEAVCSQLNVENGIITCTNGRRHNSVCSYQCNEGYETIGNTATRCDVGQNGIAIWRPRPQVCYPLCPVIMILNGSSTCSNGNHINSQCNFRCDNGTHLLGSVSSRCTLGVKRSIRWFPDLPFCIGKSRAGNNTIYTNPPKDNKVTFLCEFEGFPLPTIQWKFYNGTNLPLTSQYEIADGDILTSYQASKTLTVYGVDCLDTALAEYGCFATNRHSTDPVRSGPFVADIIADQSMLSSVGNSPKSSVSVQVDECNGNVLTVTWTNLPGAESLPHRIDASTLESVEVEPGKRSFTFQNLLPKTEYGIQVVPLFYGCNDVAPVYTRNATTGRGNLTSVKEIVMQYMPSENECIVSWPNFQSTSTSQDAGQFLVKVTEVIRNHRLNSTAMENYSTSNVTNVDKNATSFLMQTLIPNTDYQVELGVAPSAPCQDIIPVAWSPAIGGICQTNPTVPDVIELSKNSPRIVEGNLTLTLNPSSERNGPISCYFVVVQKLTDQVEPATTTDLANLKQAGDDLIENDAFIALAIPRIDKNTDAILGDGSESCCNVEKLNSESDCSDTPATRKRRAASAPIVRAQNRQLSTGSKYSYYIIASVPLGNTTAYAASSQSPPFETTGSVTEARVDDNDGSPPFFIYIICVLVLVLLIAIFVLRYKRKACFAKKGEFEPMTPSSDNIHMEERQTTVSNHEDGEQEPLYSIPISSIGTKPQFQEFTILESDLISAYCSKRKNHNHIFKKEHNKILPSLLSGETISTKFAKLPENKRKNRSDKVFPSDQNRVVLNITAPDRFTDYINASTINGFLWPSTLIAAQGPTSSTLADFWRMVVEKRCETIVMVTNLFEDSLLKCEQYWPEVGEEEVFGNITVTTLTIVTTGHCKRRKLFVNIPNEKPLETTQFQFLSWNEQSPLVTTSSFLRFKDDVLDHYAEASGPVLVHGSDGNERTSCFIALVILTQQLRHCQKVNVMEVVHQLRVGRTGIFTKLNEYILLHKLLADMVQSRSTDVEVTQFIPYFKSLKEINDSHVTRMKEQYSLLEIIAPVHDYTAGSNIDRESRKGHETDRIQPYDCTLVKGISLHKEKKENAAFQASEIETCSAGCYFLTAEDPTRANTAMFWRCILESNIKCIVMLTENEGTPIYLAQDEHEYKLDDMKVCTKTCEEHFGYLERTLEIFKGDNPEPHRIQHISLNGWPEHGIPSVQSTVLNVVNRVKNYQIADTTLAMKRYIAMIHCSNGSSRSGTFIAIFNLLRRIDNENKIDVFSTVRDLRACRPKMVGTIKQYEFCYQTIADFVEEFNLYQTL